MTQCFSQMGRPDRWHYLAADHGDAYLNNPVDSQEVEANKKSSCREVVTQLRFQRCQRCRWPRRSLMHVGACRGGHGFPQCLGRGTSRPGMAQCPACCLL